MSTAYYKLKHPFTNIRILPLSASHIRVSLWEAHALSGTLTILAENLHSVLSMFFECEKAVMLAYWGGTKVGKVVDVYDKALPANSMLLSEYWELEKMGEVQASAGDGRVG